MEVQYIFIIVTMYLHTIGSSAQGPAQGCPASYDLWESMCYHYRTDNVTYDRAKAYCQTTGGRLVVFQTREKIDYLYTTYNIASNMWLGCMDNNPTEGHWTCDGYDSTDLYFTRGGTSAGFWNWRTSTGELTGGTKYNCMYSIWYTKEWDDDSCMSRKGTLCEYGPTIPPPTQQPSVTAACESGWKNYQESCYQFQALDVTWTEATTLCETQSPTSHVVVINSEEEFNFLFLTKPNDKKFWIGCCDEVNEGNWVCEDSSGMYFNKTDTYERPLNGYWNWNTKEPNGVTGENCLERRGTGLNDKSCTATNPYACEYELQPTGPCPEEQTRLPYVLNWPETQVGQVAESVEECPDYSGRVGPRATRQCVGDVVSAPGYAPEWQDIVVNDCFDDTIMEINDVITLLSQNTVTDENVTEVASDLAKVTKDTTNVDATGLEAVAMAFESIVNIQSPSAEVTSSVVDTIDNVLNIDEEVFRETVDHNAPTRILRSLEEQLTALQNQGINFTQNGNNIDVKAVQVSQASVVNGIRFKEADTSIYLPPEVITRFRNKVNDTAMVPVTFILYQNSKLFQSNRLMAESTSERKRVVGTRVISATIEGIEIYNLSQPVVSKYPKTEEGNENKTLENFQCVFWDFDLENGRGDWSNEGCMLVETTESNKTVCHCDHLNSFAVLIDVHGQKYSLLDLDVLSIIGCLISITALGITLATYLATKSLRSKTPKKILICLSFTLLCLYVVFVAGVDRTNTSSGCAFVAALLHYLTLSSVCWMGVEAVNLYLLIVKLFNHVSHFMLKAMLVAWGGPLIPVLIVVAADYTQYVNKHHCFMKPSYGFYFADLLLIFIILAFNVVVFIRVLHKLTCGRNKNKSISSDRDRKQSITRALNALPMCAILGLTWVFGFLTIVENRESNLAFQVLFCLFNSIQGLLIFVLFCVRQEGVCNVWKRWFGCSGKGKYGGLLSSSHDGRSHGTDIANTRSTGTPHFEAINPPSENVKMISILPLQSDSVEPLSKSEDKASNGQTSPQQPDSVEPLSKSEDKASNGQTSPQQPDSVEPLSKSEDKASNGQKTPQQPDSVEPLSKSKDKASNGQTSPQQPDSVEPLSKSEDKASNKQTSPQQPDSVEPLSKSEDKASNGQNTPQQPDSVEPLSKSKDKASNGQNTPQQPDSVEPLSKSEDKASNGQKTPQQPVSVKPLSKSDDKASNGHNTPQQPDSVEPLSKSDDKAANGQKTPQQPDSVEPLSKSKDKASNGQNTSQQPDSVEPLFKSDDKAANGQKTPQQPDSVEPLSKSKDKASNGQNTPLQPDSVEPLSKSEDQTANAEKTVASLELRSDRPSGEQDTHKQDA